ncbi:MAG: uroporphyrinogen-III synthase [Bacteroidota bacterium]
MNISSLLITKNKNEIKLLDAFCSENDIKLYAQSFISFKALENEKAIETEVVFFGSKNAFDFYLANQKHKSEIQIACIGEATKNYIQQKGFEVAFFGQHAGNPEEVSKELNLWLNKRSICFIKSTESKGTIEKYIESDFIQTLFLYETCLEEIDFQEKINVLVFTSPSNVNAFLKSNKVSEETKIIAWGKTTEKELLKHEIIPEIVMQEARLEELILILKKA